MKDITINTDNNKLDVQFIHDFIAQSYWGQGRTPEQTRISIENSINFGVYKDNEQIGYARVITDLATFAYLLDVFIINQERGKGYSKLLMDTIMHHPDLQNIRSWRLATSDAHGLYEKYGFKKARNPEEIMERRLP